MELARRLSKLLEMLYEAAADPQQWSLFVGAMLRDTKADCGFVVAFGVDKAPELYDQVGFNECSLANYQCHFYKHDLVLKRFREAGRKHGAWIGTRNSVLPDDEMERSEFYNDYMRPMNQYHQAGANLGITGSYPLAGMTLVRSRAAGQFDAKTITLLQLISPHLRQGFLIYEKLSALKVERCMFTQALESTGAACLAVDDKGRLQGMTTAADHLLKKADGLLVSQGLLRAEYPREDAALHRALRRACQIGSGNPENMLNNSPAGAEITVTRRHSQQSLYLAVMPFHSDEQFMWSKPAALIFIIDPNAKVVSRSHLLRRIYGLTPAEARLCDVLAQGIDVKRCAELLGITEASARFVLQKVFEKTRANSQSKLMRLILALPALRSGQSTQV